MLAPEIMIKKLDPEAIIPKYQKSGDAGFDLHCLCDTTVPAGQTVLIRTGLAFCIPAGYEMQIRLRSGIALKTPLILANAPGTIDSGYRGEVCIITRNMGNMDWLVTKGERIAQGVIAPVAQAIFAEVEELPYSERGCGGFGSTGNC